MMSILANLAAWGILGVHAIGSVVFEWFERYPDPEPLVESYRKQWGDPDHAVPPGL